MTTVKKTSTNFANQQMLLDECPINHTLKLIGGRWKLAILWQLSQQPLRFGELCRRLMPISEKMLAQQLRELENDELLTRTVFAQVPPRVDYQLTDLGQSLQPLLAEMLQWGVAKLTRDRSPADGPDTVSFIPDQALPANADPPAA